MKSTRNIRSKQKYKEAGVALFIAIFSLLLIAAVGLSLVMASGTESSLAGNYRSSTSAYYAAQAGLEEARGRLVGANPNAFGNFIPSPLPVGTVRYIVNPSGNEVVAPTVANSAYADTEFQSEFPGVNPIAQSTNSVWSTNAQYPNQGPLYKWVRITAATKQSLNLDVDSTGLATNQNVPLYYDSGLPRPSLIVSNNPPGTASQVFELTSLAVMPDGSRRLLQEVVTPTTYGLNFPSAVTLAGQVGAFSGANSNQYYMNGADGSGNPPAVPGCTPSATTKPAIGVSSPADQTTVTNGVPRPDHYLGTGGTPSVSPVSTTGALQSTDSLNQVLQSIQRNADAVIPNPPNPPGYNNSGTTYNFGSPGWPSGMSADNPQVVYVDGSFDLSNNTGYGILVVTGNFKYAGNAGWKGIILVVGDGTTTYDGLGGGNGEFDGAIFVATTRDASGRPLAGFGTVNFNINGGGGNGVFYNSCWINKVQRPPSYKILSFKEIPN